jgi:rhodanese-related sulfurtransferase
LKAKKIFLHLLLIFTVSVILGLGINVRLIKQYFRGEFQHGFLSLEKFPSITFITLPEAEGLFAGQGALFVDSRAAESYREGHISQAVNIPYEEPRSAGYLPEDLFSWKDSPVVIYCDGSECQSSIALARILHKEGFSDLKIFFGGWEEWLREGLPISRDNDR